VHRHPGVLFLISIFLASLSPTLQQQVVIGVFCPRATIFDTAGEKMGDPIPKSSPIPTGRYIPPSNQGPSAAGATPRPTAGAGGVTTPPPAAQPEPSKASSLLASAGAAARGAEAAVSELEDARIGLADLLGEKNIPRDQFAAASNRVEKAQIAANTAVDANIKAQTASHAESESRLQQAQLTLNDLHNKEAIDPSKLDAAKKNQNSAIEDFLASGRSLAVALNLRDVAENIRPGRRELARDVNLDTVTAAKHQLQNAYKNLNDPANTGDQQKVKKAEDQLRNALSTDRAEWEALHNKAVKDGNKLLAERSEFELERDAADLASWNSRK
jgi:hypothetical protein